MTTSAILPSMMAVASGGALGAVLRYAVSLGTAALWGGVFPWGTLCVNCVGSFLMGMCAGFVEHVEVPSAVRLGIMTGVLGGFTTFSAFSVEGVGLWQKGMCVSAVVYGLVSMLGCVFLAAAGFYSIRNGV